MSDWLPERNSAGAPGWIARGYAPDGTLCAGKVVAPRMQPPPAAMELHARRQTDRSCRTREHKEAP